MAVGATADAAGSARLAWRSVDVHDGRGRRALAGEGVLLGGAATVVVGGPTGEALRLAVEGALRHLVAADASGGEDEGRVAQAAR